MYSNGRANDVNIQSGSALLHSRVQLSQDAFFVTVRLTCPSEIHADASPRAAVCISQTISR